MAKFRFQLDPLLELRRRAERDQQLVIAGIESERQSLEDRIRSCGESIDQSRSDLRDRLNPGSTSVVNAREAAWQTHSMHRKRTEADALVITLAGLMKRLEREREVLIELARDRRSLEKLRERRQDAWNTDRARRERIELDDLACIRGRKPMIGEMR
ncbi:MAG: flagellar export protein FliJ [Phycisphaerales bacterium]